MLRKGHILAILVISISVTTFLSISATQDYEIPVWVKEVAGFWVADEISDQDFGEGIEFLIENDLIKIPKIKDLEKEIVRLKSVNDNFRGIVESYENEISKLRNENQGYSGSNTQYYDPAPTSGRIQSQDCDGHADCFSGEVTEVIDGDTIKVEGQSIRFALVDTPEYGDYGYSQATNFIASICPVGSIVLVDEDDKQTQGSYGRTIAVVYCNGMNLNKAVLDQGYAEIDTYFCSKSEFEYHSWAQVHGCAYEEPKYEAPKYVPPPTTPKATPPSTTPEPSCDPSYPDFCIPPPPPDLNCSDISQKRFTVLQPDPHHFDGDKDGIGCES